MAVYDWDVIIVGGRAAGSTLAARLGQSGLRVLLLERAAFPSLPAVSSPIIYASTMKMLDEIGAPEAEYARNTPRIHRMVNRMSSGTSTITIPMAFGRDYAYAIDRARFDETLWNTALKHPTVQGRQNFSVTDLVWEGERVVGVTGHEKDGAQETLTADLVIGADGRFSVVARKTNAKETDVYDAHPTSIYYAYWRNVTPFDHKGPLASAYDSPGAYGYLVLDSADGQVAVAVEGRSDELEAPAGQSEAFYLDLLQRNPALWSRLAQAERVTSVRGMRHIANLYRQPGGAGWALVGDAYHQKDPLDGQGLYDAVATARALTHAIRQYKRGLLTWHAALAEYDETCRIVTYGMYKSLQRRIYTTFYQPPALPPLLQQWIAQDDTIMNLMGRMLTRQIPPDMVQLLLPPLMIRAMARGAVKEGVKRLWKRLPLSQWG
jgi:flavin-dependent dehydrogenase